MSAYRTPEERAALAPARRQFRLSWLLDSFLSGFRWYRRLRGGHWERFYVYPPVSSLVWTQREHGERPFGEGAAEDCEEYR